MNPLIDLINESKRTNCKIVANYSWSVLFHYAINNPDYKILLESDGENKNADLIIVKDGRWGACIPVTKIKPVVLNYCYTSYCKKNKEGKLIVVKRKVHKRVTKLCLPGQTEYLLDKLNILCPNWFDIAHRYLINV